VEFQGGRFVTRLTAQQDLPTAIGTGFRTSVELGKRKSFDTQYQYNTSWGRLSTEYSQHGSAKGVRASAAGSAGFLGGHAFAARRLGASFAEVRVGNQAGVRVYVDNQLIGVTGDDGTLMLPDLRAFEPNSIRIDDADLPMNAQSQKFETVVRPYERTGTVVSFDVSVKRGALLRLFAKNRAPLPSGTEVQLKGAGDKYIVVTGGEVFIPAMRSAETLTAAWPGGTCTVDVILPANDDPQPFVDNLICGQEHYASR
jgi:outer membrane usher protein